jgi:hypothetical protein
MQASVPLSFSTHANDFTPDGHSSLPSDSVAMTWVHGIVRSDRFTWDAAIQKVHCTIHVSLYLFDDDVFARSVEVEQTWRVFTGFDVTESGFGATFQQPVHIRQRPQLQSLSLIRAI